MAKNKIRAAIIGCGRIASLFAQDKKRKGAVTHAQAYLEHPRVELAAAADLSPERLGDFGKAWNIKNLYADYHEMLRKENIDLVSVCTPTGTHFQVCRDAIKAGVKGIFCEKPMMASLEEADQLSDLLRKNPVVFAVNHSRRWDVFERKISKMIQSGKLGTIQSLDAYYTAGIANTGSHLIDLILMLTQDTAVKVQAFPKSGLAADPTVDTVLSMKSGFQCYLHGLEVKDYLMFEIDIYGSKGRIRVTDSGFNAEYWKAEPHKVFSGYQQLFKKEQPFGKGYQNVLSNAVSNLVKALEKKEESFSGFSQGLQVLEIISAVNDSLHQNGRPVTLPLQNRSLKIG